MLRLNNGKNYGEPSVESDDNVYRRTDLHIAASLPDYDEALSKVNYLLAKAANPNVQDCFGQTPMHLAARNNNVLVLDALLAAGGCPLLTDLAYCSAIEIAEQFGAQDAVDYFSQFLNSEQIIKDDPITSTIEFWRRGTVLIPLNCQYSNNDDDTLVSCMTSTSRWVINSAGFPGVVTQSLLDERGALHCTNDAVENFDVTEKEEKIRFLKVTNFISQELHLKSENSVNSNDLHHVKNHICKRISRQINVDIDDESGSEISEKSISIEELSVWQPQTLLEKELNFGFLRSDSFISFMHDTKLTLSSETTTSEERKNLDCQIINGNFEHLQPFMALKSGEQEIDSPFVQETLDSLQVDEQFELISHFPNERRQIKLHKDSAEKKDIIDKENNTCRSTTVEKRHIILNGSQLYAPIPLFPIQETDNIVYRAAETKSYPAKVKYIRKLKSNAKIRRLKDNEKLTKNGHLCSDKKHNINIRTIDNNSNNFSNNLCCTTSLKNCNLLTPRTTNAIPMNSCSCQTNRVKSTYYNAKIITNSETSSKIVVTQSAANRQHKKLSRIRPNVVNRRSAKVLNCLVAASLENAEEGRRAVNAHSPGFEGVANLSKKVADLAMTFNNVITANDVIAEAIREKSVAVAKEADDERALSEPDLKKDGFQSNANISISRANEVQFEKSSCLTVRSVESVASVVDEYIYKDCEYEVTLIERRCPSLSCSASTLRSLATLASHKRKNDLESDENDANSESFLSSLPEDVLKLTAEEVSHELAAAGSRVTGPVTPTTIRAYARLLYNIWKGKKTVDESSFPKYSRELNQALKNLDNVPWEEYHRLEQLMSSVFVTPRILDYWRGGTAKVCFNYLLLDPVITRDLPLRAASLSHTELFRIFVSGIFYIGKGCRARPYAHLYEALKIKEYRCQVKYLCEEKCCVSVNQKDDVQIANSGVQGNGFSSLTTKFDSNNGSTSTNSVDKISRILKIWDCGLGVVSLHVFQHIIPAEAWTREAAMIDAIGLSHLSNSIRGSYYGPARCFSARARRCLGVLLLHRAMLMLLCEGERQLRPLDLPGSHWVAAEASSPVS